VKGIKLILIVLLTSSLTLKAKAQTAEAEQLLLNWEKLTQLKAILENMYDGYKILHKGYTAVRDLSEGNFSLHKAFLDGLLEVSPAVKNYRRIADIINYQIRLVSEYKAAYNRFKEEGAFTPEEITYLGDVYARLLRRSAEGLEELTLVLTAGELRMSEDERLQTIDRIYEGIVDQYSFLRHFNSRTALLSEGRLSEKAQIELSKKLQGY
jgi:hypothetical protein